MAFFITHFTSFPPGDKIRWNSYNMPLIKSISGIRGTLGDVPGQDLTDQDVAAFVSGFARLLQEKGWGDKVVVGRDARPSGPRFAAIVAKQLGAAGLKIVDLGLATTPSVELAVYDLGAAGGIVITASHNPLEWNALKFLNHQGEFLSAEDGARLLELAFSGPESSQLSVQTESLDYAPKHIASVLSQPLVNREAIARKRFRVVVDGINSIGGLVMPELLRQLGAGEVIEINCEPNGSFAHNPEPLEANLRQLKEKVKESQADLGLAVDPDVDRLVFVDERGEMFGEEYTLVAVADYIFSNYQPGEYEKTAVSNLSSSRALADVAARYGGQYFPAAVGELNVVEKMKEVKAAIGGEGNGGVIYPPLHYGRDSLIGASLFLSGLAISNMKASAWRASLPEYHMVKDKIALSQGLDLKAILAAVKNEYKDEKITDIDGVKIDWPEAWVHLRASNTEPIIRIYAEAKTEVAAAEKVEAVKKIILANIKQ